MPRGDAVSFGWPYNAGCWKYCTMTPLVRSPYHAPGRRPFAPTHMRTSRCSPLAGVRRYGNSDNNVAVLPQKARSSADSTGALASNSRSRHPIFSGRPSPVSAALMRWTCKASGSPAVAMIQRSNSSKVGVQRPTYCSACSRPTPSAWSTRRSKWKPARSWRGGPYRAPDQVSPCNVPIPVVSFTIRARFDRRVKDIQLRLARASQLVHNAQEATQSIGDGPNLRGAYHERR